ncbi:MAG: acyl-phosphate glycerol 3-phosphate acyltransferase [Deltaproteobacteria bacterium]|nr:MAG: acyl-phosphate glycerol 3-phosphate acyltransferase [Deltaproteobacteria bacterium]
MTPLSQIAWPIGAYLLGSIPFGLLLARCKGIDLRRHGSGNIGATNVARVMGNGWWWGLITLTADLSKGFLPVFGCKLAMAGATDPDFWIACTGLGAVLGHCYSIFLGFRGGKGVATAAGVFMAVCPFAAGIAAVAFLIALKKWGYVSAGSLAATALMPVLMYFFCPVPEFEFMAWVTACIIWIRHRDNIKRLMNGEEKSWKKDNPLPDF